MKLIQLHADTITNPINIDADEQFADEFLRVSHNNKVPAIVDSNTGVYVFGSSAILIYLAKKTAVFLPKEPAACAETLQ